MTSTDPLPGEIWPTDLTGVAASTDTDHVPWVRALCPMLEVLCAVGDEEHLTRAARTLGLPQPTVSRTVARIERRLGLSVVERHGRRIRLTPAGQALVDGARVACAEVERAAQAARGLVDPGSGLVRLAYLHTLPAHVVPQVVRAWRQDHPTAGVALSQDFPGVMLARLARGELDFVITSPLPSPRGRILAAPLVRQPLRLAVPAGHRLAGRTRARLREVAGEPFVLPVPGYGLTDTTLELCAQQGFTPVAAFEAADLATARSLVAAGFGVAVLPVGPPSGAGAEVGDGTGSGSGGGAGGGDEVVELDLDGGGTQRTIGLVWRAAGDEPAVLHGFREYALAAVPRLFAPRSAGL